MYICENVDKLESYRSRMKIENCYPEENELPLIYVESRGVKKIDLQANYGLPYYDEIDINLISETNTSCSRKIIYSNYERVLNSISYIVKNECRPISVLKDGDAYYIENGKHRYLAYIILGKNKIPVSIRERVSVCEENNGFIQYKRNLFSDDGKKISYPEKVIEFYEENKGIFSDIKRVEMQHTGEHKYKLLLEKSNQDVIEISNGISAGSNIRSSMVVMKLISKCGYDIDETYIKTHQEFVLEEKYDANNLKFNDILISDTILQNIKNNINMLKKPMGHSEKINKLHTFLCKYEAFNTCGTHMDIFHTGIIKFADYICYIISSEDKDCTGRIYSYIFFQENEELSNLKTKYIGKIKHEMIFN